MTKKQLKQKKSKKWLFWLLLLVLLVAAGAGTYLVWDLYTKNQETATKVEEKVNEAEAEESDTVTAGGSTVIVEEDAATGKKKVKQYEGEDSNEMANLSGIVTSTYQDAGNLVILTSIDQFLSDGSCELDLQQNGQTIYTDSGKIVADVSSSYCDALEVPLAGLAGNYQIVINLNAGEKTGIINGEVNL